METQESVNTPEMLEIFFAENRSDLNKIGLLSKFCLQNHRTKELVALLSPCIDEYKISAEILHNFANALVAEQEAKKSITFFIQAIRKTSKPGLSYCNLASALLELGRYRWANHFYQLALQHKPELYAAYQYLSSTYSFSENDPLIKKMEDLLNNTSLSNQEARHLCCALGKAYYQLKKPDQAFEYIQEANERRRSEKNYSIQTDQAVMKKIREVASKDFIQKNRAHGAQSPAPIFILGMPRSGTTLVEQIISSHPLVFGAGEKEDIRQILWQEAQAHKGTADFPDYFLQLNPKDFSRLGESYLNNLNQFIADSSDPKTAEYFIDKMPHNFLHVGMIRCMLPEAKIIHCIRNPIDTCWSCYKNEFIESHPYSNDLQELATYYRSYSELMHHWYNVLPGEIFPIVYEDLIADQENKTKELLSFCGLDFDPACLEFYKTRRSIRTLSNTQVRKPIYKNSVSAWKAYEKHLQPLIDTLELPEDHPYWRFDKD